MDHGPIKLYWARWGRQHAVQPSPSRLVRINLWMRSNRSVLAGELDLELFLELAAVVHLDQDVGSTHKFPFDINLRNRGPF